METIKPTNDDKPIQFIKHPRDTFLGASLVLEGLLQILGIESITPEKINEATNYLLREFNDIIDDNTRSIKEKRNA